MLTKKQYAELQQKTIRMLKQHKIAITKEEEKRIEIIDHGLGYGQPVMVEILVYENNDIYCAKELVMFFGQIVPEHRHPPLGTYKGKQETFRCRVGEIYLYVPGKPVKKPKADLSKTDRKQYFTNWHEIILKPGQQYTLPPNTWHWFQAGPKGAIVSEFSSRSVDPKDMFTDPGIKRMTVVR
jgi:D-lyxose ketol-isomerase